MAQVLLKIGNKRVSSDPVMPYDWLDGHIINIRPDGYFNDYPTILKHFCVLQLPFDFFSVIGATDYKSVQFKQAYTNFLDLKKYFYPPDASGKMPWDVGYIKPEGFTDNRMRQWFIDLKALNDSGLIENLTYKNIYDKSIAVEPISIDRDLAAIIKNEDSDTRTESALAVSTIGTIDAAGTYTVGTSQTYADWSTAAADLPTDLDAMSTPGNVTLQGNTDEEIVETTAMNFGLDTGSYQFKIAVASGVKHNGTYSGHRVALTGYDSFGFSNPDLLDVIVEDLAFDGSGYHNDGLRFGTFNADGTVIAQRCVVKGGSSDSHILSVSRGSYAAGKAIFRNNIVYDGASYGIDYDEYGSGSKTERLIYNNTIINCPIGIYGYRADSNCNVDVRNNLCAENTTDYSFDATPETTSKNVSSDSTSPDGATYQGWDYSVSGCFTDYNNDDFTLNATDSTLDDGDDLSAIGSPEQFSDDNTGQLRDTWFAGANEFVSGGANAPTGTIYGPLFGPLGGPV